MRLCERRLDGVKEELGEFVLEDQPAWDNQGYPILKKGYGRLEGLFTILGLGCMVATAEERPMLTTYYGA